MPVIHNYTDKEQRKFKIKIILYVLIAILLLIIFYPKKQAIQEATSKKENEIEYICFASNLETEIVKQLSSLKTVKDLKTGSIGIDSPCTYAIARNIKDTNEYRLLRENIYFLVARYDSPIESISEAALLNAFTSQTYSTNKIVWDTNTDKFLHSRLNIGVGQKVSSQEEIETLLKDTSNTLAIISPENLKPTQKVIEIGGIDPLNKEISLNRYLLADTYWITGQKEKLDKVLEEYKNSYLTTNFDQSKLTTIVLTGSSQINGDIEISNKLKDLLKAVDIRHINNETSIYESCNPEFVTSKKCTQIESLSLITNLNFDVVGVNGNHIMDYGRDTYIETLLLFKKEKISYFAGGINEIEAHAPAQIATEKLSVSFLGYNLLYPYSYYSSGNTAGSANVSETIIQEDLAKIMSDFTIFDMGWGYDSSAQLAQSQLDYEEILHNLGAKIIVGTNSEVIQPIYLYSDGTVFFGPGTFIPALSNTKTIDSYIPVLYFYQKQYLGFRIIPIYISNGSIDLAQGENKDRILGDIYSISKLK